MTNLPTIKHSQFGFTNDKAKFGAVFAFRDAAVADGWTIRPTYGEGESVDRASTLNRDGYVMMVLTRTHEGPKWKYEADVSIWGPDGLAILPPPIYDMAEIKRRGRICLDCGAENVETARGGFAGRSCKACAPIQEAKLGPGYYN